MSSPSEIAATPDESADQNEPVETSAPVIGPLIETDIPLDAWHRVPRSAWGNDIYTALVELRTLINAKRTVTWKG